VELQPRTSHVYSESKIHWLRSSDVHHTVVLQDQCYNHYTGCLSNTGSSTRSQRWRSRSTFIIKQIIYTSWSQPTHPVVYFVHVMPVCWPSPGHRPLLQPAPSVSQLLGSGTHCQKLFVLPHLYLRHLKSRLFSVAFSWWCDSYRRLRLAAFTANNGAVIQITDWLIDYYYYTVLGTLPNRWSVLVCGTYI